MRRTTSYWWWTNSSGRWRMLDNRPLALGTSSRASASVEEGRMQKKQRAAECVCRMSSLSVCRTSR